MAANSAQPRSDAYVGMLIVSLLAQITGVVFLYLDWSQYPAAKPLEPQTITSTTTPGGGGGGMPKGGMPK